MQERRSEMVLVRTTPSVKRALEIACAREARSLSDYTHLLLKAQLLGKSNGKASGNVPGGRQGAVS